MLPKVSFPFDHLHPILVNFTAALVPTSLGSDVLGRVFKKPTLTNAGWWTMAFAATVTPMTAVAGLFWRKEVGKNLPQDVINLHQWLGISIAVVLILLAAWRGTLHSRDQAPGILYLIGASLLTMALIYQGSLGGLMAFGF
jgi:uncharacterized membrane protein